ncbi:MAG: fasciclin domain-containing protein, partial [Phycisphaerales bacterium]|nr:fasciclin domain-containing protein [Phycisphaerales bacterium]
MFRFVAALAAISVIASSASAATIVDRAVATDRLSTLVTAVKAAGLVEALSGDGPVTVFAPDNAAFGRLDDDAIAYLLTDDGKEQLTRILLHHVVAGRLDAASLVGTPEVTTLAGTTLSLEVAKERLLVNDAVVETADIGASNGVVHIIDRVLLPPVQMTALETLMVNAIDRGVPLFNEGSPEGCAAVYATALDAVAAVPGFGLSDADRMALGAALERIEREQDMADRAWAYRRLMDALLNGEMGTGGSAMDT